jgi:transcriptional regulator with XRE-family HTH domain
MTEFSKNLKQLRTDKKITQMELADYLHVSQNAIFNWENGKREPSLEIIQKIADYFNVSCSSILGWDESGMCEMHTFQDDIDDYLQELGEFLYYNPEHKQLFDCSMDVKPQDVPLAKEMLNRINGKNS